MNYYYPENARYQDQREKMLRLEQEQSCLFCPDKLATDPAQTILKMTGWWSVTPNRFPYRGARHHLLVVPSIHVADILDLPAAAKADFWDVLAWVRAQYDMTYYGLGVRCGDCRFTGGTIRHLHVHVIVGDVQDPRHEPIRMKFSSRPSDASELA